MWPFRNNHSYWISYASYAFLTAIEVFTVAAVYLETIIQNNVSRKVLKILMKKVHGLICLCVCVFVCVREAALFISFFILMNRLK